MSPSSFISILILSITVCFIRGSSAQTCIASPASTTSIGAGSTFSISSGSCSSGYLPAISRSRVTSTDGPTNASTFQVIVKPKGTTSYYSGYSSSTPTSCFQKERLVGSSAGILVDIICQNYLYACPIQYNVEFICVADPNAGTWTVGSWGSCSATCGGGTQIITVTCSTSSCAADTKPATVRSCNTDSCSANSSPTSPWAGNWNVDGLCNQNQCCCLSGVLSLTELGSNLLLNSEVSGKCGSTTTITATIPTPTGNTFSGSIGGSSHSMVLDGNTIRDTNVNNGVCSGNAIRSSDTQSNSKFATIVAVNNAACAYESNAKVVSVGGVNGACLVASISQLYVKINCITSTTYGIGTYSDATCTDARMIKSFQGTVGKCTDFGYQLGVHVSGIVQCASTLQAAQSASQHDYDAAVAAGISDSNSGLSTAVIVGVVVGVVVGIGLIVSGILIVIKCRAHHKQRATTQQMQNQIQMNPAVAAV